MVRPMKHKEGQHDGLMKHKEGLSYPIEETWTGPISQAGIHSESTIFSAEDSIHLYFLIFNTLWPRIQQGAQRGTSIVYT